jgi:hemerythrin-like domain-containing protein
VADPIAAWQQEHDYFARLLRLLQREVDAFHRGSEPNFALMLDIVTYLREYSDQFHHPREDVAFARLARHRPDVELVLSRLQQEHRVIAHAGAQLLAELESVLQGMIVPRERIEAAAATYLIYYGNHLHTEDHAVLPHAAAHLTAADWEAVRQAVPATPDPLFGPDPHERFRRLRRQIAQEETT